MLNTFYCNNIVFVGKRTMSLALQYLPIHIYDAFHIGCCSECTLAQFTCPKIYLKKSNLATAFNLSTTLWRKIIDKKIKTTHGHDSGY